MLMAFAENLWQNPLIFIKKFKPKMSNERFKINNYIYALLYR